MSDLLESVRKKSKTQAKFTANIYPPANITSSLPPLLGRISSDNDILHLLTSPLSFRQENNKSHRLPHIVLTKNSPVDLYIQLQLAICWASSFFSVTHIDTGKILWAFSPRLYDATLSSTSKIHSHFKMSTQTSVPLLCLSNFYSLLWHKSLVASFHGSHACHRCPCAAK